MENWKKILLLVPLCGFLLPSSFDVKNADAAVSETVPETSAIEKIEDAEAEECIEELEAENGEYENYY